MSDLISRQAAIDALIDDLSYYGSDDERAFGMSRAIGIVEKLPPAQPETHEERTETHTCVYQRTETHKWIPVSERLPDEKQDVLLAFKHNMVVGFWEDILDNGEPAWYANSGDGWMTGTESVDSDGIPIAWMPLPEPYKGEQE